MSPLGIAFFVIVSFAKVLIDNTWVDTSNPPKKQPARQPPPPPTPKAPDFEGRAETLRRWASNHHFSHSPSDETNFSKRLGELVFWKNSRGSKISNVIQTTSNHFGTSLAAFDFQCHTPEEVAYQTVIFLHDFGLELPRFQLMPEKLEFTEAGNPFPGDIDFVNSPDFSKKFYLFGEFENLIRAQFGNAVRNFLAAHPNLHLEADNFCIIAYQPNTLLSPNEIEEGMKFMTDLADLFKNAWAKQQEIFEKASEELKAEIARLNQQMADEGL